MIRTVLGLSVVAVLLTVAGCRMCQHPYDYCGPVYDRGCDACCPDCRAGSILSGSHEMAPSPSPAQRIVQSEPVSRESLLQNVRDDLQPGYVAGSEQIMSVTDQAVGSSDDSFELASEPSTNPSQSLPTTGWTARRPTPAVTR